jgi:hypothetical protein
VIHPVILPETIPQRDGQNDSRGNPVTEQAALEGTVVDEDSIDIDLDDEDPVLREAIPLPLVVKMPGGKKVITVPHMLEWEHEHTLLGNNGDWDGWAKGVLSEADYQAFKDAHLQNYQIQRIMEKANKRAGTTPGKSRRSSGSSRSTARR